MESFIDRDPEKMIQYGKNAEEIIGNMILTMRKIEGVLDYYAADLDTNTQAQIAKLHESCSACIDKIDIYSRIAQDIKGKGQKLRGITY